MFGFVALFMGFHGSAVLVPIVCLVLCAFAVSFCFALRKAPRSGSLGKDLDTGVIVNCPLIARLQLDNSNKPTCGVVSCRDFVVKRILAYLITLRSELADFVGVCRARLARSIRAAIA